MKYQRLLLAAILLALFVSCQQMGGDNQSGNSPLMDENFKQIANNFRSESDIVVEEGTEEYIGQFDHRAFLEDIFEGVLSGKIIAYDFFDTPLSIEEVRYLQHHTDTAEIEDFETGKIDTVLIVEEFNPDEVVKIFTVEDWYFDKENFKIEKKVISMTLTTLKLDLEGEPIGYEILFKVYLDGRDQMP